MDRLLEQLTPAPEPSARDGQLYRNFADPQPIAIRGYEGESLDPFITRDGRYLFFNSSHFDPQSTALHYATRVDDGTFDYQGEIAGVNIAGVLTAVASMDRAGNFYFISPRSYKETGSTIHRGTFKDGAVTDVAVVQGLRLDEPGQVNFDVEISADGNTLYFVDSDMRGSHPATKGPRSSHFAMATRTEQGFKRLETASTALANVNTPDNLEFAAGLSANDLELFFTRFTVAENRFGIWRAARARADAPFEQPQRIAAIDGFTEAPALSPDGRTLYYHKREGDKFAIWRVTRAAANK